MSAPDTARVVVVGGGIVGASIAYHLVRRGVDEVVLLERGSFTGGTTWHAAGLVGQLRATQTLTRLARHSLELYQTLEAETGQGTGFRAPGSLSLATTPARMEELQRTAALAGGLGVEVHTLNREDAAGLWPLMDVADVVGAVHLPGDAMVNPVDTTMALLAGARAGGALTLQHTPVTGLLVDDAARRVCGVTTEGGTVRAETVVLATGLWTRELAARYGVTVPLHAAHHYYVVTQPLPGLAHDVPILRDPDRFAYYKEDAGRLLVGVFEPGAIPWDPGEAAPGAEFLQLEVDMDHLGPHLARAFDRIPALGETPLRLVFDGPESFTPDDRYIIGEAPTLDGLFVAAGFNSIGIQSAGGVGWVMADWIATGEPPMDLADVDVRRFEPFQVNRRYLRDRSTESLGLLYDMHWPFRQVETARGVRRSPLHDRLAAAGACFGEVAGWERPNWFAPAGVEPRYEYSYGRQNWFGFNAAEHRAVREAVGLFDMCSYATFEIHGDDALAVLDTLSANDVDVAAGSVVYTQWCNGSGGIEADLTVTRLEEQRFLVVTSAAGRVRDRTRLERAARGRRASVVDTSSGTAAMGVMGPQARALLQGLTPDDLGDDAFPYATSRVVEVGYALVRALRVSYVGELGWELYMPSEFALHVYEELTRAGADHGLRLCGFHTLNSCRVEKGYRHWGHDIGPDDTPLEAGLGFAVAWDKPVDFTGRAALERRRVDGARRRLLQLAVHDETAMLYGHEPVLRDGRVLGEVSSGMWGHTVGAACGMGYATRDDGPVDAAWVAGGQWQVEIAGRVMDAAASLRPWYDPAGTRLRG